MTPTDLTLAFKTLNLFRFSDQENIVIHREILRTLLREHLPQIRQARHGTAPQDISPDLADEFFETGTLSPQSYGFLALAIEMLRLEPPDEFTHLKLWGYVMSYSLSDDQIKRLTATAVREGILDAGVPEYEPRGLKPLAESMLGHVILYYSDGQVRYLLDWLHESYEPYLTDVLQRSFSDGEWLRNVSFLIGRLLMRNMVPAFEGRPTSRGPSVTLGRDFGFTDPGTVAYATSLYRALFTQDEMTRFAQQSQRMEELFAHAYPVLLRALEPLRDIETIEDSRLDLYRDSVRAKIRNVQQVFATGLLKIYVRDDRLRARIILEDEYRRYLAMPKYVYDHISRALAGWPDSLDSFLNGWPDND